MICFKCYLPLGLACERVGPVPGLLQRGRRRQEHDEDIQHRRGRIQGRIISGFLREEISVS